MAIALSFLQETINVTDQTTYTFSGVNFGTAAADRIIAVVVHSEPALGTNTQTITSATIGGVSATILTSTIQGILCSIIYANVPLGTTGDVVVTVSNTGGRMVIGTWRITGAQLTHTDAQVSTAASGTGRTISLNLPPGAAAIVGQSNGTQSTNMSWSGATERYQTDTSEALSRYEGADVAPDGANRPTHSVTTTHSSSSQPIVMRGVVFSEAAPEGEEVDDERDFEAHGKISANSARTLEAYGKDDEDAERALEAKGAEASDDERAIEAEGNDKVWEIQRRKDGGEWETIESAIAIEEDGGFYIYDDDAGLEGGSEYCYRVRNVVYESDWSNIDCVVFSAGESADDEREIEAAGQAQAIAARAIDAHGESSANDERAIEAIGQVSADDSRELEAWGVDDEDAEREIEATGSQDAVAERDVKAYGQERLNAARAVEAWAQDTADSQRSIEVEGAESAEAERAIEVHGVDTENAERAFEAEGAQIANDTRDIEAAGIQTLAQDRNIEATGSVDESAERSIETHGQAAIDDERAAALAARRKRTARCGPWTPISDT